MSQPILYEAGTTNFFNLGLGVLTDTLRCQVIESRNGEFYLELEYPVDAYMYSFLTVNRIIKCSAGHELSDQRFVIKKITDTSKGTVSVYGEHVSYLANDLALVPEVWITSATAKTALDIWKKSIIDKNDFRVDSDITSIASTKWEISECQNARQALGGTTGSILECWHGEFRFDNYHISLLKERGKRSACLLAYGKNITDLEQEKHIINTYTSIYPYAIDQSNQQKEVLVTLNEYFVDSEHVKKYPNRKVLPVDFSGEFTEEEKPTAAKLKELAKQYIVSNNIGIPTVSMRVSFLDLSKTLEYKGDTPLEEVNLCDTVQIFYERLGIHTSAKVIRTVWNVLLEQYDELEIGEPKSNLSSTIKEIHHTIKETDRTVNEVQTAANGKNTIFRGPDEPIANQLGDMWYKPAGTEIEFYIWNGTVWEFIMSTKGMTDAQEAADEAKEKAGNAEKDAEKAKEEANQAVAEANRAVEDAGLANQAANTAKELANQAKQQAESTNKLAENVKEITDATKQQVSVAQSNAQQAVQDAKEALDLIKTAEISDQNLVSVTNIKQVVPDNNRGLEIDYTDYVVKASLAGMQWDGIYFWDADKFERNSKYMVGFEFVLVSGSISTIGGHVGAADILSYKINGEERSIQQWSKPEAYQIEQGKTYSIRIEMMTKDNFPSVSPGFYIQPGRGTVGAGQVYQIKHWFIKRSEFMTTWTPAPEDIQVQLSDINGELSQKISQSNFDSLKGIVSNQETLINQSKEQITLKANKTDVDTLSGKVDSQGTKLTANAKEIALKANQSSVDTLTGRVSASESLITTQAGKISAVSSLVDNHTTQIGSLNVGYDKISSTVSKVQSNFENVEYMNLLPNSKVVNLKGYSVWGATTFDLLNNILSIKNNSSNQTQYGVITNKFFVEENRMYSFQLLASSETTSNLNYCYLMYSDGKGNQKISELNLSKEMIVRKMTFSPNRAGEIRLLLATNSAGLSGSESFKISLLKVYRGEADNVGWSTADEDFTTNVQFSDLTQTVDKIQTTVAGKADTSQITQLANRITSVVSSVDTLEAGGSNWIINSESQKFAGYQGTTAVHSENITVDEWKTKNARRVVGKGGTNTVIGMISAGRSDLTITTKDKTAYVHSVYIKNNHGTKSLFINSNLGTAVEVKPNESKRVHTKAIGNGRSNLQINFVVHNVGDEFDFVYWRPMITEGNVLMNWCRSAEELASQTQVTQLADSISSTVSKVEANIVEISNVKQTASSLSSTVTKVQTDLNDISIGGRNYFSDSGAERTASREFVNHNTWDMAPLIDKHGVDTYYTVSFDIKAAVAGKVNVYSQNGSRTKYTIGTQTIDISTKYKRFDYTFKPRNTGLDETKALLAFYGVYDSGVIPVVKNVKFELGNKATDWTPAPEDTEQEFSNIDQTIKSIQTTVAGKANQSQVTQLTNQITSVVTELGTDKVNLIRNADYVQGQEGFTVSGADQTWINSNSGSQPFHSNYLAITRSTANTAASSYLTQISSAASTHDKEIYKKVARKKWTMSGFYYIQNSCTGYINIYTRVTDGTGKNHYFNNTVKYIPNQKWEKFEYQLDLSKITSVTDIRFTSNLTNCKGGNMYFANLQFEEGSTATSFTPNNADNATQSQITQLSDNLNLRVQKNDVVNQINISKESILIAGNKVQITGNTYIEAGVIKTAAIANAAITDAKIGNLSANKITTGTLNAANVNIINMNAANISSGYINSSRIQAGSITADKLAVGAILVGLNNASNVIKISSTDLSSYNGGKINMRMNGVGFYKYDPNTGTPMYSMTHWGAGKLDGILGIRQNYSFSIARKLDVGETTQTFGSMMTFMPNDNYINLQSKLKMNADIDVNGKGIIGSKWINGQTTFQADVTFEKRAGYIGNFEVYNGNTAQFWRTINMNGWGIQNSSGHSLKADFQKVEAGDALRVITDTDVVSYVYKENPTQKRIGFVINDDEMSPYKTSKELIVDEQYRDDSITVGYLMLSTQALNSKITKLEAEIETLKSGGDR